jgi:kynurenine formamidase
VVHIKVVDLSMEIRTNTPVFQIYPIPIVHTWTNIREHGFYSNLLMLVEHTGTHVDAPAHVIEGGETIDSMPLERFMGDGVVVDASALPPKASITRALLEEALRRRGVGRGWVVLVMTGYDSKAGTPQWFEHPGLDGEAADYLVELGVNAVGIDAPSMDHPPYPAHERLLRRGILIYENLTNLRPLIDKRFKFIGVPLRIAKGSASPVRAIALLEE